MGTTSWHPYSSKLRKRNYNPIGSLPWYIHVFDAAFKDTCKGYTRPHFSPISLLNVTKRQSSAELP